MPTLNDIRTHFLEYFQQKDHAVAPSAPLVPQNDPTLLWPAGRTEVKAGTLTIRAVGAQAGAECERINFDPMVMADGIAPTADPVLRFRSPAYGVSFAKRLGGS